MSRILTARSVAAAREALGRSASRLAVEVIGVRGRSVRRWQSGDSPIRNQEDRAWLVALVELYAARPAVRKAVG